MNTESKSSDTFSIFNDLPYAQTPQRMLSLDLRVPRADRPMPLVMYIPVGGMRACDKAWAPWWLTELGFAMASINVRTSPEVIAPLIVYDCKSAVRWLRAHAPHYGYSPDAIGVWGHSAGGLLSSLLGTSGDVAALEGDGPHAGVSSRVQAVCDECGAPHDFAYFLRPEIKNRFAGVSGNLANYLGAPLEDRLELARLVSPQTYISRECPPVFQIHGDHDSVVPVAESLQFHESLLAAGVDSTIRVLPGIDHGWDASLTRDDIIAFFERTLRPRT